MKWGRCPSARFVDEEYFKILFFTIRAMKTEKKINIAELPIELNRDNFCRSLIRELAGTLQDLVGLEEASGFVSVVGQNMGQEINEAYKRAAGVEHFSREEVAEILVDLKHRIKGDFYLIKQNEDELVFGNRACPFAEKVNGRPAMCMMTSNVFGAITADHLGYARVELKETIAEGHPGCRVVVHLKRQPQTEGKGGREGREYFRKIRV